VVVFCVSGEISLIQLLSPIGTNQAKMSLRNALFEVIELKLLSEVTPKAFNSLLP